MRRWLNKYFDTVMVALVGVCLIGGWNIHPVRIVFACVVWVGTVVLTARYVRG